MAENEKSEETKAKPGEESKKPEQYQIEPEADPVITEHEITFKGKKTAYTASAGMLPLRNELGDVEAGVFHVAYTVKSDKPRPITFTFNGGPGSSSVWLHMGAVGPKKVILGEEGMQPQPPAQMKENAESWLEFTDLVFVDPVGTGFSRSVKKKDEKKFWGLKGDVESVGTFIREYLSKHDRWTSPIYLAGESYGTTRAAGLSDYLFNYGIALNGIVLVSSILNFQTARFSAGNDLPFILFLPTYAAAAWYHKKVSPALQKKSLRDFLTEVENFVNKEYVPALQAGDELSEAQHKQLVTKLSGYLGLDESYIDLSNLRVQIHRFCKELLRKEKRVIGRFDVRYKGIDGNHVGGAMEHDPSGAAITSVFTSCLNDYVRRELGYRPKLMYNVFASNDLWKHWDWGKDATHPDTSEALRSSMSKNPFMKVYVANGFYDLATPYFATEYTVKHMGLDESVRSNIEMGYYEAGHMMYVRDSELAKLKHDVEGFYKKSLSSR